MPFFIVFQKKPIKFYLVALKLNSIQYIINQRFNFIRGCKAVDAL